MDLAVLRTAKAALDEGLINTDDFDAVKRAFVRAQSIKAGRDAGFIGESDFAEARYEFFRAMGMISSSANNVVAVAPPVPAPAPAAHAPAPTREVEQLQPKHASETAAASAAPSSAAPVEPVPAALPAIVQPVPVVEPAAVEPAAVPPAAAAAAVQPAAPPVVVLEQPAAPTQDSVLPEPPSSIPDYGGAQATAGKASMSGITVHPDAVNIVGEMRIRKKYRWLTFKIGQAGKQVELDRCGGPTSTFQEFATYMPENECRYGVYDYEYRNSEGTIYGKLVFVSWAPEVAPTKAKMQHASTKDFFRGFLDGISVELHATDHDELDDSAVRERVSQLVAKK